MGMRAELARFWGLRAAGCDLSASNMAKSRDFAMFDYHRVCALQHSDGKIS